MECVTASRFHFPHKHRVTRTKPERCHQKRQSLETPPSWLVSVSYGRSAGQRGSPRRAQPQDEDHAQAEPARPRRCSYPSAAARLTPVPLLPSWGASTMLPVLLHRACHKTKPKPQATATLLALTDPRGDKYFCLPLHEQSWW